MTTSAQVKERLKACRERLKAGDRKGYDQLKRGLPMVMYMATFDETEHPKNGRGRWRKQAGVRLSGLCMADFDHVDRPDALFKDMVKNHFHFFEDDCPMEILLVHITPSGVGLRVVFKADLNHNLADNQKAMARAWGLTADEACKDASRGSFMVSDEDILYLNEKLFTYENAEYEKKYGRYYRDGSIGGHAPVANPSKPATDSPVAGVRADAVAVQPSEPVEGPANGVADGILTYHGVPIKNIVDCWLVRNGSAEPGDRHRHLLKLAYDLRYICDSDHQLQSAVRLAPFVSEWERTEHNTDEIDRIVASARQQRMYVQPPKRLQDVLVRAGVGRNEGQSDAGGDAVSKAEESYYDTLWNRIKPLLSAPYADAVAVSGEKNALGAIFAAGTMYCTLLTRTWYEHYDGTISRMNPQAYIIGRPATGKGFADRLNRDIMAVLRAADEPGRQAERRYKEQRTERSTSTKAQKGEALKRPEVVIRNLPSRTSNAVFYRRALNAVERPNGGGEPLMLHLYMFDSELDSSVQAQSGGSWIGKHDLELKAFHNEWSGVDYSNNDSVNENIQVFWNTVTTGTDISLAKKINIRNVNDGLCSRMAIYRMYENDFHMLERGNSARNHDVELRLKEWGFWFDRQRGELPIRRLVDHCYELCAQSAWEAEASSDHVLDYLRKRAVYYAEWFTVPRILARLRGAGRDDKGNPIDKPLSELTVTDDDLRFATLIYESVIYWQDRFFGRMLQESWENAEQNYQKRPQTRMSRSSQYFDMLPESFDVKVMVEKMSITEHAARQQLQRWKNLGWVKRVKHGLYQKLAV